MITRQQALDLLHSKMQSQNLRRHSYSVEAAMRALAQHLDANAKKWGIVGLLHDGDYEFTKTDPANHAKLMANWVRDLSETDEELLTGIESHGWFHEGKLPQTQMQWALFCCDELTGLIVATTLVQPDKKLADVTVEKVLSKFKTKSFAAGLKREDIIKCEGKLGLSLEKFVDIVLKGMQAIATELGL